ncbi:hypothetical protein D3C78_1868930 [compost metagenome]
MGIADTPVDLLEAVLVHFHRVYADIVEALALVKQQQAADIQTHLMQADNYRCGFP